MKPIIPLLYLAFVFILPQEKSYAQNIPAKEDFQWAISECLKKQPVKQPIYPNENQYLTFTYPELQQVNNKIEIQFDTKNKYTMTWLQSSLPTTIANHHNPLSYQDKMLKYAYIRFDSNTQNWVEETAIPCLKAYGKNRKISNWKATIQTQFINQQQKSKQVNTSIEASGF